MQHLNTAQAASWVRNAIRRMGTNPKGMVSVMNNDFVSEVTVNLSGLTYDEAATVEELINDIDGSFSWNVESSPTHYDRGWGDDED
tara:strand:+ start:21 stop:278 length:258 start_codon:yes stop_codon:yes gene_type:complete